ncbi:MAG: cation:proton antiporter, partial [Thermoplasmata archaeon]
MALDFIATLLILLSVSMLLGVILSRFKIPDVVSYIISGLILGDVALRIIKPSVGISDIESVSLFFIILGIGIESNTEYIYGKFKKSAVLSLTSFIVPFLFSFTVLHYAENIATIPSMIISLSVSVPSISIVSVLLLKYGFLTRNGGQIILSSVVLTDVIAFVILSSTFSSLLKVLFVIIVIILFFFAIYLFDKIMRRNAGRIINWLNKNEDSSSAEYILFSLVIIAGLLVSEFFDVIGIT